MACAMSMFKAAPGNSGLAAAARAGRTKMLVALRSVHLDKCYGSPKNTLVIPRTKNQERYISMMEDPSVSIIIATGHAGCGKSMLATTMGMDMLRRGEVDKVILTRPAISVDEQHGFLPGTLENKMLPWMRPLFDVMEKQYRFDSITRMIKDRVLEICPLAFMRGRTFENAWIICDEAQNCTPNQMLMILTRLGRNSKLVITGDPFQHDRGFDRNGLTDLLDRLQCAPVSSEMMGFVEFDKDDVQRHPAIPYVLSLYQQDE